MKCLITGITGFAGPHLAGLLLQDSHTIHGLARESNGREMSLLDLLDVQEQERIMLADLYRSWVKKLGNAAND